jgi:hypothetical protein
VARRQAAEAAPGRSFGGRLGKEQATQAQMRLQLHGDALHGMTSL